MKNLSVMAITIFGLFNLGNASADSPPTPQSQPQVNGPAQPVSINDATVQKAALYATQQTPGVKVAKVLQAQRQGKDAEIYVMTVQMTNGKIYRVEVCAPQNKPWKLQNMQPVPN